MKKKGKYNTLLLVKAFSLEPNAPLIVTGLKEGVHPLGGQFIAATPLQICYIEGYDCKRPSDCSILKGLRIFWGGPFVAALPLKICFFNRKYEVK